MTATAEGGIRLDARRHGLVLAAPLARSVALAAAGGLGVALGWPVTPLGALAMVAAAVLALVAVWRWERTHVVVTTDGLYVVHGTLRRRSAGVPLSRLGAVEVEQTLLGRLLGYGTVIAGDLEISYVPRPRELRRLLA